MAFGAIGLVDTYPALLGCLCVQGVMAAAIQPAAVRAACAAAVQQRSFSLSVCVPCSPPPPTWDGMLPARAPIMHAMVYHARHGVHQSALAVREQSCHLHPRSGYGPAAAR
jgi:hypothetical protein